MNVVDLYVSNYFKVYRNRDLRSAESYDADIIALTINMDRKVMYYLKKSNYHGYRIITYEELLDFKKKHWDAKIYILDLINSFREFKMKYTDEIIRYISTTDPKTGNLVHKTDN